MTRILRGLGALLILTALLVGAPIALVAWVGNPWPPGGWAEVQLVTNATISGTIAVIAWAAWTQLAISILIEAGAAIRGYQPPRLPLVSDGQQRLVRALVAAVATLGVSAATIGAGTAAAGPASTTTTSPPTADQQHHTNPDAPSTPRVVTEQTTTLWQLAETHLGDGARWRDLLTANRGTHLPDGTTLAQGTQSIPPGTTLRLPPGTSTETPVPAHEPHRDDGTATIRVQKGDTLWGITEDHLGDPTRYPEVFKASRPRVQPGGDRLFDPDHIEPGWHVTIPQTTTPAEPNRATERPSSNRSPSEGDGTERKEKASQEPQQQRDAEPAPPAAAEDSAPADEAKSPPPQLRQQTPPVAADNENPTVDTSAGPAAPWVLPGLTGGGVVLAGAMLLGLQALRRRQFRNRRPGRAIDATDPQLAPVEKTISAAGAPAAPMVEWLDEALRRLAASAHERATEMPPIAAVELHADIVTLHLSGAADLPGPWQGTPDRLNWHCTTHTPAEDLGPATGWVEPPYPLLVTIGHTDQGHLWMLNCEEVGSLAIAGDIDRGRDMARHLAAQLAVNPWSRSVSVDCVGIAEETAQLSDRIHCHPPGPEAAAAVQDALAAAVATVDRTDRHDTDTSTGRTGRIDEDVWPARMLFVDANTTPAQLGELLNIVSSQVGRTGTSIVLTGDQAEGISAVQVTVTAAGRAILEHQGLDLAAVGLTSDEAYGCGQLFAQSGNIEDTDQPVDESATDGWAANADRAGALRREHTRPRTITEAEAGEPVSGLLELDDSEYSSIAPVTPDDLEALAPRVPNSVRAKIEADDPTLDAEVADWFDPDSHRPKLALLGPVKVTAHGKPLATSKAYCVELVAYLATEDHRKNGVTRDQVADAFFISTPAQVRKYINMVRHWLGTNSHTGEDYLPDADKSPASKTRGTYVYQICQGLLVDQELFKRLRQRGMARGGIQGHRDLIRALELVSGQPFDQLRPEGWSWLKDTGDENHMVVMIADTALTVTTRCLAEKDLAGARAAAQIAATAAPDEETTHMSLACVAAAEGNTDEAARIVREKVYNRVDLDEPPPDVAARTRAILANQEWLAS